MPSTRTRRASRRKSTSPSIPRLRNNSKRSILCLTTVVLLVLGYDFRSRMTRWLAFGYTDSFTPPPGTLLRSIAAQEAPPSPVSLRNGHQPPAVSPVAPIGVNHWDERWTARLAPLVSSQEPAADQPDCTDGEVAAAPPATVAPRKPTFLQRERWTEGEMEGGPESPAQGHVAAGNRTGVGHPQVHRQELSGGRRSSRMEAADGTQSVDIGYHGSVTE